VAGCSKAGSVVICVVLGVAEVAAFGAVD